MKLTDRPDQPSRLFNKYVPDDIQQAMLEAVGIGVEEARKTCEAAGYDESEFHDVFPHVRRAHVQRELRALAPQSNGQLRATARKNKRKTSYHSVLVRGPVIFTESWVSTHDTIVRSAEFRKTYADTSQMILFPEVKDDDLSQIKRKLYAILIYGPSDSKRFPIGFVHIVFPSRDASTYLGRIDLCKKFPGVIGNEEVQEERIPDAATPKLRTNRRKVEGQ